MSFSKEPEYTHGNVARTAIVLVNLGTPDAPTAPALRRYLKEFLSDRRVVEIPRALWLPILYGAILPFRSKQSAAKYATIWMDEGSPLRVHSERQTVLLREAMAARGHKLEVRLAMRYGNPGLPQVLDALKADGVDRLLILPAYPQYSGTTTASVADVVFRHFSRWRNQPELRMVKHYHDHAGYIEALRQTVQAHWQVHGRPDRLVMSFHGVPKRTLLLGDPYHCECQKTGRLLGEALGLSSEQYLVTYQSRFGKAEWLQPYTEPTLEKLGREGVERVDVMCPGFTSDCIETLEEIAMEGRQAFLAGGGNHFHYIPCLNAAPAWISALADIAEQHLAGWPTQSPPDTQYVQASAARAASLGAPR